MKELTPEAEDRALRLYRQAIVVDALNASMMDVEYLEKMRQAGVTVTNYTVAMNQNMPETARRIVEMYRLLRRSDAAFLIETAADIREAKRRGQAGVILGFQNIAPLEGELGLLEVYYRLGIRIIQLTYHFKNICGDGCLEPTNSGLSLFGKSLIKAMNDLGIVVDLAHVGEATARDAIEESRHPVIASHSNAYGRVPTYQNKDDVTIKALAEKGGVIGITAFPRLLEPDPTLDTLLDHVDHVANLVGTDHVGIGLDFSEGWAENPAQRKKLLEIDGQIYDYPEGINTVSKFPNIARGLVSRGYSDRDVEKILGGNFLRVFETVMN